MGRSPLANESQREENMEERTAQLNTQCQCISVDETKLNTEVHRLIHDLGLADQVAEKVGAMLSKNGVFISATSTDQMKQLVKALFTVCAMPKFQETVLHYAPTIARHQQRTSGVFYGFDFHLGENGPQLIEINTNAGGAMICALEIGASKNCCVPAIENLAQRNVPYEIYDQFIDMFTKEWRSFKNDQNAILKTIAIVDESPAEQFLYPEFLLFKALFKSKGIHAIIAGPDELKIIDGKVSIEDTTIDLIYNRTTDFYFESPSCKTLREVYLQDLAAITPNPFQHAVFANKQNLCILSNDEQLMGLGIDAKTRSILLEHIPKTVEVSPQNEDALWENRKQYFFKPTQGFGSRAVYRGDKMTKSVWSEIKGNSYVAQQVIPPSRRTVVVDGVDVDLKVDIRDYAFEGISLLCATRTYQGQTTNLRTLGGGFSPVYEVK